jgi:pyrroloquinoline quinone (PQQ) biosynthesis protein C
MQGIVVNTKLEKIKAHLLLVQMRLEEKNDVQSYYILNRYVYPLQWVVKQTVVPFNDDDQEMYDEFLKKYQSIGS